jgi:hypothetical protein
MNWWLAAPVSSQIPATASNLKNVPISFSGNVVISGLNFGHVDLTSTAAATRNLCQTTFWTSGTSVGCAPDSTSLAATATVVTIAGLVGTGFGVLTVDGTNWCLHATPPT